ncbi:MAG TPA: YlxR family protein [Solirubrobacteraceae bacterium]|nr:YlxR family protein [Solirubrobacteraceae bacterium]
MPRRRCVGCGRIAPKSELLRIAAARDDGGRSQRAVIDFAGTLPGRGAYLCKAGAAATKPNAECLRLAERRRGIARALRCAVTVDPKLVESTR